MTDNRRPCLLLICGHKKTLKIPLTRLFHLPAIISFVTLAAVQLLAQQIYEVRPGDTLSRIAATHGLTVAELAEYNSISDPTRIRIGQKIKIPQPEQTHCQSQSDPAPATQPGFYTVVQGDTIYGIARKLQISPSDLMKANNLDTNSVLKIGQRLKLPVSGKEARPSSESSQPQPPPTEPPTTEPTPSPQPTEQPSPTPTPENTRNTRPLEHRVVAGDTLSRIAARYGVSVSAIAAANRIQVNSILRIGQVLRIPVNEKIIEEIRTTPPPQTQDMPLPQPRETPQPQQTPPTRQTPPPRQTPQSKETPPPVESPPARQTPPPRETPKPQQTLQPRNTSQPQVTPPPRETRIISHHIVQPGEDITTIAEQYGLTVEQLRDWNNLRPGQFLRIGQRLRLTPPGGTATPPEETASEPTQPRTEPRTPPAPRVSDRARAATSASTGNRSEDSQETASAQRARRDAPEPSYVYIRPVKAQIDRPRIKRGRWRYVVVHHSETTSGNAAIFDRYHRNVRKWENGLAYHFVIGNGRGSGDGQIEVGQRWKDQLHGGHLRSAALNEISIGICLVGSYNVERPTARQIAATIELVQYLRRLCGNPRLEFTIHRRINPTPTDCPGKLFPERTMFQRLR